jgi:thermostable 8-oxoguanine DNA glycosylase
MKKMIRPTITEVKAYSKFADLEQYLFGEVHDNFLKNHFLSPLEFYSIVIWKSNRSKTLVKKGLGTVKAIEQLTREIYLEDNLVKKVDQLVKIKGIGYPIASAILSVCYPDDFTVVDYRAKATLKRLNQRIQGDPTSETNAYLDYVTKCRAFAKECNISLRILDKYLWGYDFVEGKNGLKDLIKL